MSKRKKTNKSRKKRPVHALQEIEELIDKLRPVDDDFFHKLSEEKGFCEELLQTILENDRICLKNHIPR